jgi:hypothetical protein
VGGAHGYYGAGLRPGFLALIVELSCGHPNRQIKKAEGSYYLEKNIQGCQEMGLRIGNESVKPCPILPDRHALILHLN